MEVHSDIEVRSAWYNKIAREIGLYKDTLSQKDYKKYKLDLLLRIARRADSFSPACGECQTFQGEISRLIQDLSYSFQVSSLVQMSREERKSYNKTIKNITKHLQKQHKLVTEGYYIGIAMAIGIGVGAALGTAIGNAGIGTPLGIVIGFAVGQYLDKKAKKEGRVI